ncbi:hypothetical protein [Microbacterium sp.]|uniref:hypothetical protein n=1 Tax=Microbacterium sp. TaxID=51671 RepID=UPI002624C1DB|nr:hypothetical protein [Microbacterium sp.]
MAIGAGTVVEVTPTNTLTAPEVVVTGPDDPRAAEVSVGGSTSKPGGPAATGALGVEAMVWWGTGAAVLMLAVRVAFVRAVRTGRVLSSQTAE